MRSWLFATKVTQICAVGAAASRKAVIAVWCDLRLARLLTHLLWPPCVAVADIIFLPCGFFFFLPPRLPQIDIIGAVVMVWRVSGKTIRSVLCNIVCNNCAQCNAHTHEQTNSSLDWVLSHWAISLCLDEFLYCVLLCVACMCRFVKRWGGPGGIKAYP